MEPGGTGLESELLCIIYILLSNTQRTSENQLLILKSTLLSSYNIRACTLPRNPKSKYHSLVSFLLFLSHKSCYPISILVCSSLTWLLWCLYWYDRCTRETKQDTPADGRQGRGSRRKITDFLKTCSQQGSKFPPPSNSPSKNYP